MALYQAGGQRDPLLDQGTQAMLERRARELMGVGLILFALLFVAMLGSYSATDPGWMVATDQPAQNWLGRFGAAVASTLIIICGKGAWGIPVVSLAWGVRFVAHRGAERATGRVVFAVIAIALGSVFAATHVPGAEWAAAHTFGLGGLFGDTVLGTALGVAPVKASFGLKILSLISGLAVLGMYLFVTGVDREELQFLRAFLLHGMVVSYAHAMTLAGQGAANTARAAAALQDRQRQRKSAAAAYDPQGDWEMHGDALTEPMVARQTSRPTSRVARAEPLVEAEPAPNFGRPASLRADNRQPQARPRAPVAPQAEPPLTAAYAPQPMADFAQPAPMMAGSKKKEGFLARMRRAVEPEAEAYAPAAFETVSSDDRIKARISDVIKSRVRNGAQQPQAHISPITAAIQRREPSLSRPRGPQPLIADTRRPAPAQAAPMIPAEPPVVAPATAAPQAAAVMRGTAATLTASRGAPLPLTQTPASPFAAAPLARPSAAPRWQQPEAAPDFADTDEDEDHLPPAAVALALPHDDLAYADDDGYDWDANADLEPDYTPAPVMAPTPAPRIAQELNRRPVVQPAAAPKPAAAPHARVMTPQPRQRFEELVTQDYELPPLSLLASPSTVQRHTLSDDALEDNARMLESVLEDYGVKGEIVSVRPGPVVTMYELEPAPGLKASRVIGLADDIARSMSALSARVSTVPGRTVIGIELPNATREKVVLREILSARDFGDSAMRLPLALGKDIGGDPIVANLAKMPHLLIAGTTGSGKSVAINTMILSLLYKLTPEECRLIMIDPKMLELSVYDGIPHLLSPVVTDPKKAVVALKWVVGEMEERYRKMSKMGVRNIEGYNGRVREALAKSEMFKRTIQTGFDEDTGEPVFETEEFAPVAIPYIVVIVDEMADLMMVAGKEIEACIQRLAQMARASGIHLIMATQRPSVDVITGTIKANFPTRISFQVTSKIDSRTILGEQGAEQLLGMGDMLYMAGGSRITRIHGPFVSDEEVEEIVNHLKSFGPPSYMSGVVEGPEDDKADDIDAVLGLSTGGNTDGEDALYDQAVAIVAKDRKCSTSYIQRKLGIGYNKAARLVEQMEENHVVTPANHVGKREILIPEA